MKRTKKQKGGSCGCSTAASLGFPQNGGQMNYRKNTRKMNTNTNSMNKRQNTNYSSRSMNTNTNSMNKRQNTNYSSRSMNIPTTPNVYPSPSPSLNKQLNSVYNSINVTAPKFGGGMFDWLMGKQAPSPMPMAQQKIVQPQQQMVQPQQQMVQPQHQSIQQEHYPNPANVVKRSETPLTTKALFSGGYKPTKRNMKALRKYKKGKSIGYTMRSSLKAKGLIARANGSYKVSKKYRG